MKMITNIVVTNSALNGSDFKESVDLALVCAAFEHQVNLIFTGEGVTNLVKDQSSEKLADKNQVNILKGLEFYDVENIYADELSVSQHGLKTEHLIESVSLVSLTDINELSQSANNMVII